MAKGGTFVLTQIQCHAHLYFFSRGLNIKPNFFFKTTSIFISKSV